MTDLSPQARAILEAGKSGLSPDPVSKERVLAAVEAKLAAPAVGGSGAIGSGKLLLALTLAAAIGTTVWILRPKTTPVAVAPAAPEQVLEPAPLVETEPVPAPLVETEPVPAPLVETEPEPAVVAPRKPRKKATPKPPPSTDTLLAERKLIAAAQRAIRAGDYAGAKDMLARHKQKFPRGILAPERDAASAISMCLSQDEQGKGAGRRFLAAHPNSPLAGRVRSSCALR